MNMHLYISLVNVNSPSDVNPENIVLAIYIIKLVYYSLINKGNNKITELRTILQMESQNS